MTPLEQAFNRLEEIGKYGFRPPIQYIRVDDSLAWVRQDLALVKKHLELPKLYKKLLKYIGLYNSSTYCSKETLKDLKQKVKDVQKEIDNLEKELGI